MDVRVLPDTSLEEPASSWLTACSLFFHRQWNGTKKGEITTNIGRHGDDLVSLLQVGTATDSMEPPEASYRKSFRL